MGIAHFNRPEPIPILGQAMTIKGAFATVVVVCGCDKKGFVMIVGTSPNVCPECGRLFKIKSVHINEEGQAAIEVGVVQPQRLQS